MRNRAYLVSLITVSLALGALGLGWPIVMATAGDQQPARENSPSPADKSVASAVGRARRQCLAHCDLENGQCNSEVRQSRQECSKQAANGGNDPFSARPEAFDYYCGYFDMAQCEDRRCAQRFAQRYADCVQWMRGNVTSRRFSCIRAETKAQALCRIELRDCRTQCE